MVHRSPLTNLLLPVLTTLILISSAAAQSPQPGFADAVLGRWDLTIQGPDGTYPSWLDIMLRKETQLMGRFVGRFGSLRHVAQIEYRDGELLFRVPVQYEPNSSDLTFKARLVGDRLEGTTENADGKPLTWTAVRATGLTRSAAPKWGKPIHLFNGKDLTGWKLRSSSRGSCWSVVNGSLSNNVPCVDIVTEQKFTDFKLHLEFNIVEKSNSGVYLRGRYEVQIQDDIGKATDSLRMGGLYGFLRPTVNAAGKPGAWQSYDITLVGRRVTVVLNGKTIIDNEDIPGITGGALDSEEDAAGPIMLQGDHGKIAFKNIIITPVQ
jgi:3-keto-disaccharide hydrolase